MKDLWIVGAGGFGREMFSWLISHPDNNVEWKIKGFVDDKLVGNMPVNHPIQQYLNNYKLVHVNEFHSFEDTLFVLAIGEPKLKEKIANEMKVKGVTFLTFIHPTAIIGHNVTLGEGVIICPYAILTCDIFIEDFVTINIKSAIGHDVKIGEFTTLSGSCDVTGNCTLGTHVLMGTHANLMPHTKVENYATIGAGSLGIRKIKENTTIIGVPGKVFKMRV